MKGQYLLFAAFVAGALVSALLFIGWLPEWLAPVHP